MSRRGVLEAAEAGATPAAVNPSATATSVISGSNQDLFMQRPFCECKAHPYGYHVPAWDIP
ncbi:hypothetical protein GCM10010276_38240 [Streptomyces longisporus]|uniref:Uncharacterized protein n=1 Tax=Streptomyces longisporus TaxID=1948 RepID=A0ABN3M1K4_STRLO